MKPTNLLVRFAALALAAVSLNSCFVGRYMCNYALKPEVRTLEYARQMQDQRFPGNTQWYDALVEAGLVSDTTVVSRGSKLYAWWVGAKNPSEARGTAIIVHGYTDNHLYYLHLVRMYRDSLNYNVFIPDLYYHGLSEGDHANMGWFDRLDVENWIPIAHEIFNDDFMVLHGVSMGAATVMMTSGDELPGYVKAFVEDCGYSSVWDQFKSNLKDSFGLPPFPVLNSASFVCKQRYGWGFKEASAVEQLAKCERPMLFIHGEADDFVPTAHVYVNFDAKTKGYKEMWIAPGSEHARSFNDHPAEYTEHVRNFLLKAKNL